VASLLALAPAANAGKNVRGIDVSRFQEVIGVAALKSSAGRSSLSGPSQAV